MTYKFQKIYYTVLFMLFLACAKEDPDPPPPPEPPEPPVVIDTSFYDHLNNNSTLDDYVETFRLDAIRQKSFDPFVDQTVSVRLKGGDLPPDTSLEHIGIALGACDPDVINIEIYQSAWNDYTVVQKLLVVYHEMGHDRYRYRHTCEQNEEHCSTWLRLELKDRPIMFPAITASTSTLQLDWFVGKAEEFFKANWMPTPRYFTEGVWPCN